MVLIAAIFYGLLGSVGLFWVHAQGRPNLLLAERGEAPWQAALLGLLSGLGVVVGGQVLRRGWQAARDLEDGFRAVLGRRTAAEVLALALLSGTAEEIFFRGAMQPRLGLIVASVLFGAVHFIPRRAFLLWTPFAIAVGFLLGWLYESTGSIYAPIATHVTINAINLWTICGPGSPATPSSGEEDSPPWASPTPPPSPPSTDSEAPGPPA